MQLPLLPRVVLSPETVLCRPLSADVDALPFSEDRRPFSAASILALSALKSSIRTWSVFSHWERL